MPIEANFSSVRGFTVSYKVYAAGCFAVHGCLLWADVTDIKKNGKLQELAIFSANTLVSD
jgi:hypothetical protein